MYFEFLISTTVNYRWFARYLLRAYCRDSFSCWPFSKPLNFSIPCAIYFRFFFFVIFHNRLYVQLTVSIWKRSDCRRSTVASALKPNINEHYCFTVSENEELCWKMAWKMPERERSILFVMPTDAIILLLNTNPTSGKVLLFAVIPIVCCLNFPYRLMNVLAWTFWFRLQITMGMGMTIF